MKSIGIDIGTTTICSVLIDAETKTLLDTVTKPNKSTLAAAQSFERLQDPAKILDTCIAMANHYLISHSDIASIGITGQMHGILYVDQKGRAVSPLFTWQDGRGDISWQEDRVGSDWQNQCDNTDWQDDWGHIDGQNGKGDNACRNILTYAGFLTARTGYAMATGFGMTTHFYNHVNRLIPSDAAYLCTIPDYIAMRLANRKTPLIHQSMAASLGMYDIKRNKFDLGAVTSLGLSADMLPEIACGECYIGETDTGIPVTAALGDNQASFLASMNSEDACLVNVGTGSQISIMTRTPYQSAQIECRPYLGDTYLLAGSSLCGGYSYSLLKNFFEETLAQFGIIPQNSTYEIMNRMAIDAAAHGEALNVDTRFCGTRQDASITGSIQNLKVANFHPGDFTLGILQGICDELYNLYTQFPEDVKPIKTLVGSGNGIRMNPMLQQLFASTFKAELTIPDIKEEAAYGCGLLGLKLR